MDSDKRKGIVGFAGSAQLAFLLRLFLGFLFLYASIHKIQQPVQFAVAVRAYEIIPVSLSNLFALAVAWGEAVAGILLITGLWAKEAAGAVFILLALFVAAIVTTLIRGAVVDCACFGTEGKHPIDLGLLGRDIVLLACSFLVIKLDRGWLSLGGIVKRS